MRAKIKELFSDGRGEAETSGCILRVDDDQIHLSLLDDMGQMLPHHTSPGASKYVPYEEQIHVAVAFLK
jgi:hypothetical protein